MTTHEAPERIRIERLARKFCAQENEIWEETTPSNRRRWQHEARAAIREGGE